MKIKEQIMTGDGFDRNVAEKMPKIKQHEDPVSSFLEEEPEPKPQITAPQAQNIPGKQEEKRPRVPFQAFQEEKRGVEPEQTLDVTGLIEDLHHQLLMSSRAMRAMEVELASGRRTLHQVSQDNNELRRRIEELNRDLQSFKALEEESRYLKEENEEALERIRELQQELKELKESLNRAAQERAEALRQVETFESQKEKNEVLWIRGRLKEKEASHFSEENRELRSSLEKALDQNLEIERKYEALKKSFREVKESLHLLRDSCKSSYYYNMS
jgi:DNA repair exonuclease SbcCD ATPase subunit